MTQVSWKRSSRAFGVLVGHLPSAILSLPAFVSRSPPDNSCMYPSQALPKFESYRCSRNSLNFLTKVSNAYEQFHGIGRLVGSVGLCVRLVRCIKPLAQSRNETNSSWVNGANKSGFIFQICASGAAAQASHPATIKLTHYRAFRLDV